MRSEIFLAGDMEWSTEEIDNTMVATLTFKSLDDECIGVKVTNVFLDKSEPDKMVSYVMIERELRELHKAIGEELERMEARNND